MAGVEGLTGPQSLNSLAASAGPGPAPSSASLLPEAQGAEGDIGEAVARMLINLGADRKKQARAEASVATTQMLIAQKQQIESLNEAADKRLEAGIVEGIGQIASGVGSCVSGAIALGDNINGIDAHAGADAGRPIDAGSGPLNAESLGSEIGGAAGGGEGGTVGEGAGKVAGATAGARAEAFSASAVKDEASRAAGRAGGAAKIAESSGGLVGSGFKMAATFIRHEADIAESQAKAHEMRATNEKGMLDAAEDTTKEANEVIRKALDFLKEFQSTKAQGLSAAIRRA
jgi:hypothetical protein